MTKRMPVIQYPPQAGFVFVHLNNALLHPQTFVDELRQRAVAKPVTFNHFLQTREQFSRANQEEFENLAITRAHVIIAERADKLLANKDPRWRMEGPKLVLEAVEIDAAFRANATVPHRKQRRRNKIPFQPA